MRSIFVRRNVTLFAFLFVLLAFLTPDSARSQQAATTTAALDAKPDTVEWVYRIRYGYHDEWWRIFRKYQIAILERQKQLGYVKDFQVWAPGLHTSEESRWVFRVISTRASHDAPPGQSESELAKQLFPDQEAFHRDENRRWELTTNHWDAYVHDTLFPYARLHLREFLNAHRASADVRADLIRSQQECRSNLGAGLDPPTPEFNSPQSQLQWAVDYVEWLMDRDRKSTALKSLQGKIWEEGYRNDRLRAPVFDDVPAAFRRWREQQKDIAIFSSGSVLAQQLLFSHTTAGDLTSYLSAYFDTTTGAKTSALSYQEIAASLGRETRDILFISDVVAELDAASAASLQVLLCERIGNRPQPPSRYRRINDFTRSQLINRF